MWRGGGGRGCSLINSVCLRIGNIYVDYIRSCQKNMNRVLLPSLQHILEVLTLKTTLYYRVKKDSRTHHLVQKKIIPLATHPTPPQTKTDKNETFWRTHFNCSPNRVLRTRSLARAWWTGAPTRRA